MIKKVAVLLMSLIFLVSVIFYGNVFEFKLDEIQSLIFKQSLVIYGILTTMCFLVGEISKNYSQVDKIWSIAPIIYVWFFTYNSDLTQEW
jgi:steroid 5-alpha reductase family enzyme